MELEQRNFRADPLKLKRLRVTASLTVKDFQDKTGLHKDTARKLLRGDPVFLSTLSLAVKDAFGILDPLEVLHPSELAQLGIHTTIRSPADVLEWKIEKYLSGWEETSNGLQFQRVCLKHRFLAGRMASGKCYELRHMSTQDRAHIEDYLRRHADVCEAIGDHPNIAQNITAAEMDGQWWVLDRWEDGETLASRLQSGELSEYELRFILTGIANGLAVLHRNGVIRRELSPKTILLRERDDRPVLTDMELAKIVSGGPTVSPAKWPDDPYRALEVSSAATCDERSDVYSWGRIFVHGVVGSLAARGQESIPDSFKLPRSVRAIVMQSVEVLPSRRPHAMTQILDVLGGWI